ncbi:MAG TPA: hypothetical protein DF614_02355 [Methylococcaceae bacterium]|nr:hypothetical protein [Methylococcaceae bacterium]
MLAKSCYIPLKANMKTQLPRIGKKISTASKRRGIEKMALFALCFPPVLLANPGGAQILSGQVNIDNTVSGVTKITNSPGAVIQWQDFGIKKGEVTQFIQQSAKSSVLNKVVGGNPSEILGSLLSNGKVFLINPNGVLFGKDAVVDTQGLMVSTLNLNGDTLNNPQFTANAQAGSLHNEGLIHVSGDGSVLLIAPTIANTGAISTEGGKVTLAAGQAFTLTSLDNPDIQFQLQAPENTVLNLGDLRTQGGAVDIFANTITHSGTINADSVSVDKQGNIRLVAKEDVNLGDNSHISASNNSDSASTLQIKANNAIVVGPSSTIDAANGKLNIILNADADAQEGGNIQVNANAKLNSHGGNIILGGGTCTSTGCDKAATGYSATPSQASGILLDQATLTTQGGDLKLYGEGHATNTAALSDVHGVLVDKSTLSSDAGNISINGAGGVGKSNFNNNGVFLTGSNTSTVISSTSGHIDITGQSRATNGSENFGISSDNTTLSTTGGHIALTGTGANGNAGLLLESNSRIGDAQTGDVTLVTRNNAENTNSFVSANTLSAGQQPLLQTQGTLSISASGTVTQLAPVRARELALFGPANYTLTNAENTIGTLVASAIGNLRFINSAALTLGRIDATGTLSIGTNTGNLTVANSLSTSNASVNALKLNAGILESETLKGNILLTDNAKISVGKGGTGQLLTGAIDNSTGVFNAVGTGHSRYGSDESTIRYRAPLGEGLYAIYREQPTLNITAESTLLSENTSPFYGGSLLSSGFVNGDSADILTDVSFSGSSQGAIGPGFYSIIPNAKNALGYKMVFTEGLLTIENSTLVPSLEQRQQQAQNTLSQQINTVITLTGTTSQDEDTSSDGTQTLAANDVQDTDAKKTLGQCQ